MKSGALKHPMSGEEVIETASLIALMEEKQSHLIYSSVKAAVFSANLMTLNKFQCKKGEDLCVLRLS